MKSKFLITLALSVILFLASIVLAYPQNVNKTLTQQLQKTIDSLLTANQIKGISACIIHPQYGTWKGVSGISHANQSITSDMEFGIASNTKLFTGVLLLKLAENKLLNIDDSIYKYLPSYQNIDSNISIRQLLNHTSGINDLTNIPGYPDSILTNPNRIFSPYELMTWVGKPLFDPGKDWNYCNTNYILAAMVAENAAGINYGKLLRDSILTPLNLDSTFLDVYDTVLNAVAHPWQKGIDNYLTPRKSLNSAAWAAGAMYSTAGEMAQWFEALMNGRLINSQSLKEMTTFVGSGSYGIGLSKASINGTTVWQHGGNIWGGYNSMMMYEPSSGLIISVFVNQQPAQAFQIASQLLNTIINYPSALSKTETKNQHQAIYPNPASDLVEIKIPDNPIKNIKIFDLNGQLISETKDSKFSVSDFTKGIYFIQVNAENKIHSFKLIKN